MEITSTQAQIIGAISGFVVAVPVVHLWLHALLHAWRRSPFVYYLWAGFLMLFFVDITFAVTALLGVAFTAPGLVQFFGLLLVVASIMLVLSSIFSLGAKRFFMYAVLRPDEVEQKIMQRGSLKYFSHPAYLGYVLLLFGLTAIGGLTITIVALVISLMFFPLLILWEERELIERTNS